MVLLALSVYATPSSVAWSGADAGCVYLIEPGGARWRLGCNYSPMLALPSGELMPGDLVEVRRPAPNGALIGRAVVTEK